MPRTKLDKYKYKKRDVLMEIINGRIKTAEIPKPDIAKCLGITERQAYNRLKQPSEEWRLGDLVSVCRQIGITKEEFRESVRF